MRRLLTWLMVFCVLAGLQARVLAVDSGCVAVCTHESDPCCHDSQHDGRDHDGEDHNHHHDCCSHVQPLTIDNNLVCRLGLISGSSLSGVRHEGEVPPEGPYLNSEKPPLI